MVNRPRIKGTTAEAALCAYLRDNGWPDAERRALSGTQDKGDVAGTGPLVWEVKSTANTPLIPAWLMETGIERQNAGADYGILVIKTKGIGPRRMDQWLAIMTLEDHQRLLHFASATVICSPTPRFFTRDRLNKEFVALTIDRDIARDTDGATCHGCPVVAAHMMPPGAKDNPQRHYRAMRLGHMVHLLHSAGYGAGLCVAAKATDD